MAAMVFTRSPRKLPSLSSASSASVTLSRACGSLRKASERVLIHFTGRPVSLDARQHQRGLVEHRRLHAEAAAGVAGDDAHFALGHLQHLGELAAVRMRALHRRVNDVAAIGRVVVANGAARLHGGSRDAVDNETVLDHAVGAREGGVGRGLVADLLDVTNIVRAILPHARCARRRRVGGGGDGRQRLEIDLISSAASMACATVSATTKATQSPTQRTRSSARIG